MSDKKPMKERYSFSFRPDTVKVVNGEHKIVADNRWICLGSATQGELFYTPKDNRFWLGEGAECPTDTFETKYLPYLRWRYDEFETIEGKQVSSFPPTPKNIQAKRTELQQTAVDAKEEINYAEITQLTTPIELLNNEAFEKMLKKAPADERLARRLTSMTRL